MIAGVFVGGAARRMGGAAKGLLAAPSVKDELPTTVIERTIGILRERFGEVVLVGSAAPYASLGVPAIPDDPSAPGEGPLPGLVSLLAYAKSVRAVAIACDMPYVTRALVARLVDAEPQAIALAPRDGGKWSPLFARYDAPMVLPIARRLLASGVRAMQAVLDASGARELVVSAEERAFLRDWDEPADVDGGRSG